MQGTIKELETRLFAAWCEHACVLQLLNGVFKRLQHHSTFSRTKEKSNRGWIEGLNRFKFDSTSFLFPLGYRFLDRGTVPQCSFFLCASCLLDHPVVSKHSNAKDKILNILTRFSHAWNAPCKCIYIETVITVFELYPKKYLNSRPIRVFGDDFHLFGFKTPLGYSHSRNQKLWQGKRDHEDW